MKKATLLTAMALCGLGLVSQALETDILKPVIQKQEKELRRIMERLATEGLKYEVVTERVAETNKTGREYFTPVKRVKIPEDLKKKIGEYHPRFALRNFRIYLEDPKYSFDAAVLVLAYPRGSWFVLDQAIIDHDKDKWLQALPGEKKFFGLMIRNNRPGTEWGPLAMYPESYYGQILFESMPPYYSDHVFAKRIYQTTGIVADEPSPIMAYSHVPGSKDNGTGALYGKFFDGFLSDGDTSALKEIALTQPCVEHWLYLTLFGEEGKRLLALEGLLAWSRIKSPVENPFLSALAMGLFTVNGYDFNDETGVYTLNERGKMLMDFITEFPIPENATRLQAVMNGGNKDEIQAMMKKHNTTEKWAELLKNPVHPEFAKYPQD